LHVSSGIFTERRIPTSLSPHPTQPQGPRAYVGAESRGQFAEMKLARIETGEYLFLQSFRLINLDSVSHGGAKDRTRLLRFQPLRHGLQHALSGPGL